LFAAMAGSSPATCSAIGSAGIPEMRKRGYPPGFAAGIIAAGGTLGILLPPSITMILCLRGVALSERISQRQGAASEQRHPFGIADQKHADAA
jgi:TRAP-type C4-dicarboxylate transport system permease large subunit